MMMQRGRKTAPSVTAPRLAPSPPPSLTSAERALFVQTVDAHPHLKLGDTAMLVAYVRAMVRHEELSRSDNTVAWNRSGQLALAMARGLRLLPSTAARTLVRARADLRASPIAQYLAEHPDDDETIQ